MPCAHSHVALRIMSPPQNSLLNQKTLVSSLIQAFECHGLETLCLETHISWVIVAGEFAYKLKKAVKFDFLDFSSLNARRFYCEEELRLNRRFAPDLYLGICALTGSPESPEIDGAGEPIEYAVKMRAFPQDSLWTHKIANGSLTETEIDAFAREIASFHHRAKRAPADKPWGSAAVINRINAESLSSIEAELHSVEDQARIQALSEWQARSNAELKTSFAQRKRLGFIRECHGDLHCGNVLTFHGQPLPFDCLEFDENLRWIDVLSDIAFIVMDLRFQGLPALAARLTNRYLEETGDYENLAVLRFYETSRALVRCKVACLEASGLNASEEKSTACLQKARAYLAFATESIQPAEPRIMITHGFSGSGKSTLARILVEILGAVQIRSDVLRKRLHGLPPLQSGNAIADTLYSAQATALTYERLEDLTASIVNAGLPVMVDAAFLRSEERERFAQLARDRNVAFHIFDLCADKATMRARLLKRKQRGDDPSDADVSVLERQLAFHEELKSTEIENVIYVDSDICADRDKVADLLKAQGWEIYPKH